MEGDVARMPVGTPLRGQWSGSVSQTTVVHDQIRDDIVYGRLAPGAKLKIDLLQDRYGTSATPLREALSLLSATGLVERVEQRGFRVAEVSSKEYSEILSTRCFLEERALRESIAHGDRDWEEKIVLALYHLSRASETMSEDDPRSIENWETWHRAFHSALIAACPSKYLRRFCGQLYDDNNRYRYIARLSPGARAGAYEEHKKIADAVLRRDADLAASQLMEHFRRTADLLHDRLAEIAPPEASKPALKPV